MSKHSKYIIYECTMYFRIPVRIKHALPGRISEYSMQILSRHKFVNCGILIIIYEPLLSHQCNKLELF